MEITDLNLSFCVACVAWQALRNYFLVRRPSARHTFYVTLFYYIPDLYSALSNNFFSTQRIGLRLQTNVYIHMCDRYTKGLFITELLYLFMSKINLHLQITFFLLERLGWNSKSETNVYINMCDGYTKREGNPNIFISELLPLFLSIVFSDKVPAGDTRAPGSTSFEFI